jgi:hypothetical protein
MLDDKAYALIVSMSAMQKGACENSISSTIDQRTGNFAPRVVQRSSRPEANGDSQPYPFTDSETGHFLLFIFAGYNSSTIAPARLWE